MNTMINLYDSIEVEIQKKVTPDEWGKFSYIGRKILKELKKNTDHEECCIFLDLMLSNAGKFLMGLKSIDDYNLYKRQFNEQFSGLN